MGYSDCKEKLQKRTINSIEFFLAIAAVVGLSFKIYYEVRSTVENFKEEKKANIDRIFELKTSNKKAIEALKEANEEAIVELKKKLAEDNKRLTEMIKDVAVMREQISGVQKQNSVILIKQDKMYDLLVSRAKKE